MPESQEKVGQIVAAFEAGFPNPEDRGDAAKLDAIMAPFSPITQAVEAQLDMLLREHGRGAQATFLRPWIEADQVVNCPEPDYKERRIRFLLMDACTCVLEHLPAIISRTKEPMDPRVAGLLKNPN